MTGKRKMRYSDFVNYRKRKLRDGVKVCFWIRRQTCGVDLALRVKGEFHCDVDKLGPDFIRSGEYAVLRGDILNGSGKVYIERMSGEDIERVYEAVR